MADDFFARNIGRGAILAARRRSRVPLFLQPVFHLLCTESGTTGVLDTTPLRAQGTAAPTVQSRASNAYTDVINEADDVITITQVSSNQMRYAKRKEVAGGEYLGGYLPEEESTNLRIHSEAIDNGWWAKTNASVTNTSTTDLPTGATSSNDVIHEDATAAASHYIQTGTISLSDTIVYCYSIFLRAINRTWVRVSHTGSASHSADFDLDNGVIGTTAAATTAGMDDYGDGWYRCWIAFTMTNDQSNRLGLIILLEGDNDNTFDGLDQDSAYAWGHQLEVVSTEADGPTSYIATGGASATRLKDQFQYSGDNITAGQGTMRCKVLLPNVDSAAKQIWTASDGGAAADRMLLRMNAAGDVPALLTAATGGDGGSVVGTTDIADGEIHTLGMTWETDSLNLYVDGSSEGTPDTAVDIPDDIDEMDIGMDRAAGQQLGGIISDIKIYGKVAIGKATT
jgi:hypothetical protein